MPLKLLVAVNPASGGTDKTESIEQIRAFCQAHETELTILMLTGTADGKHIEERVAQTKPDRLVAMGGDGTIKLVAEVALRHNLPLGILPTGSANGLARELGLPTDLTEALAVATGSLEQPIDVIEVNGELCLHLSDIGLNAQLIKYYQQNNWRGMLGYARGVVRVLLRKRVLHVTICTPEKEISRSAEMIALANARMYGTGAVLNPDGDMADGQFEVVLLRQFSWIEFMKMFWRFRPFDPQKTEIIEAQSVQISTRRKAYFQVDGEYRGRITQVDARIRPGALRVLLAHPLGESGS
ncbi:diacylglycerol kinase family lipid kinase [Rudanella paleaurantiibacter]|uniref:Diacylglycerol kinase family lipid kinase n=1 Tax=Rudanella paleaurantiibacter TaxID=2614655 RepID=A0A7J5TZY5_9BACT|nr:diacylglycerol kinase family protein [Rudanella paleaurantiibacter]KAB7731046.1 diacylglycerol kinase family lipid kinase [Rudanella paleaurantiibacter]